jgi:hypothetical protein
LRNGVDSLPDKYQSVGSVGRTRYRYGRNIYRAYVGDREVTTLAEKMRKYKTVERGECPDCANRWYFDEEESYVCTTCAKTIGKCSYVEFTERELKDMRDADKCL